LCSTVIFGCARIRSASGFGRCLNEPGARHRAEHPRLEAADRIDALVEEALLVATRVFVDGGDPILVDDHLRAAVGGLEHGLAEQVSGLVVAPQERAVAHAVVHELRSDDAADPDGLAVDIADLVDDRKAVATS